MKEILKHGAGTDNKRSQKSYQKARSGPLGQVLPLLIAFIACFLHTGIAFAQVQITEIMYDTLGADSGREWVEVTNTGSAAVDIGKYKLEESGTNHGLKLISGATSLLPGASAVIAADAVKFKVDNPAFAGVLFDSTFSLSNTGERLVLKDASSTPLDTASYTAAEGANGEGGSLHLLAQAFIAAMPNPGAYPGDITAVPKAPAKAAVAAKTKTAAAAKTTPGKNKNSSAASTLARPADLQAAGAAGAPAIPALYLYVAGTAVAILLGIAGVLFVRFDKKEPSLEADEFEIQ